MKTSILIPAVGKGKRFIKSNYKIFKPFLSINKKLMIDYVYDNFPNNMEKIIIVDKKIEKKYIKILKKKKIRIIKINSHNKGPAYSILLAKRELDLNQSYFVSYCDITWEWNFRKIKQLIEKNINLVFTYKGFHPYTVNDNKYAFCKSTRNNKLLKINEKKPFTSNWTNENLSIGCFFFKIGKEMIDSIHQMIKKKEMVSGEYYPSLSFNFLKKKKLNISIEQVNNFCHLGKPEYFEDFNKWLYFFQNNKKFISKKRKSLSNVLILPCAGAGSRFKKEKIRTPKPFIKVEKKEMYRNAIDYLPNSDKKIIIFRSKDKKYIKSKKNNFSLLSKQTNGQAVTCFNITKNLNLNSSILIGACDTAALWNINIYKKLIKTSDVIVWTCKNDFFFNKDVKAHTWIEANNKKIKKIYVKRKPNIKKNLTIMIGIFFFTSIESYNKLHEIMIKKNNKTNGEFYIDNLISECISSNLNVKSFNVDCLVSWGTPLELNVYNFWSSFFRNINNLK